MNAPMSLDARGPLAAGLELLTREQVYLDEQRWDEWLGLFAQDCEYWVPTWKNEEQVTTNPQAEVSHIYYANRAGLEDRVVRIRSRRSPACAPMPRTTHVLGNVLPMATMPAGGMRLRSSWVCHVFFPRLHDSHAFFGRSEHELVQQRRKLADPEEKDAAAERLYSNHAGCVLPLEQARPTKEAQVSRR
jgi:3-phenylpropionate/cinnamic acid dioxygenase small subunit